MLNSIFHFVLFILKDINFFYNHDFLSTIIMVFFLFLLSFIAFIRLTFEFFFGLSFFFSIIHNLFKVFYLALRLEKR